MSTPPSVRIGRWAVAFRAVNETPKRGFVWANQPAVGVRNAAWVPGIRIALKPHDQSLVSGLVRYRPSWRTRNSSPKRFITGARPGPPAAPFAKPGPLLLYV